MHSNRVSVIITMVVITTSLFLLVVYYGKQAAHTFRFLMSL